MDAKNAIDKILHDATGKRASGRELLVAPKRSYLDPKAAAVLKEQWTSAGRDNAFVVMMLSEEDGSNPHFVTGWNGKDTFVCLTERGLAYVDHRHLEKLQQHDQWNPKTRLIELRAYQLTEEHEMHSTDVDMLLDRIKRTLKKSNKKRRKGRLRNMEKFFNIAVVESKTHAEKAATSGPDSETEFEAVDEKDDRIPEAPKEPSTQKLPKDAKAEQTHRESFDWRKRCAPNHPMMQENATDPQLKNREHVRMDSEGKGSSGGATPGGNKCDPQYKLRQLVRMNRESKKYLENTTEPQLDKRELVDVNKEGGGGGAGATPGGNKCDPQDSAREQVDVRHEDKAIGAKDSSDKSDDPDYTTYAGDKAKDKEFSARPKITVRHEAFGDDKAKKLFGPGAAKKSPEGAKKPLLMLVLMGKKKTAPMSEGKKPLHPAFLANIEKMKAKAKARKGEQDLEQNCA